MADEIRVGGWAELQEALFADTWRAELRRFRSPFAYRGVPAADLSLATSLQRLGAGAAELEGHLLRNFRKYARRSAVPQDKVPLLSAHRHHCRSRS